MKPQRKKFKNNPMEIVAIKFSGSKNLGDDFKIKEVFRDEPILEFDNVMGKKMRVDIIYQKNREWLRKHCPIFCKKFELKKSRISGNSRLDWHFFGVGDSYRLTYNDSLKSDRLKRFFQSIKINDLFEFLERAKFKPIINRETILAFPKIEAFVKVELENSAEERVCINFPSSWKIFKKNEKLKLHVVSGCENDEGERKKIHGVTFAPINFVFKDGYFSNITIKYVTQSSLYKKDGKVYYREQFIVNIHI